jgi:hypothetical protein
MSFDLSTVINNVSDDLLGDAGESLGLKRDTAVKAGKALAANWSKGKDGAIAAAAQETGLAEDVVSQLVVKVVDAAKEKAAEVAKAAMNEGPIADAVGNVKEQAIAALGGGGGFLGKLFGKK